MSDIHVVILAAGKGTRMKSAVPKVLHRVAGTPMIDFVLSSAAALQPRSTTVVVGHEAAALKAALSGNAGLTFVVQEPQLGTAHALLTAEPVLRAQRGTLVMLSGDVPLLTVATLQGLVNTHVRRSAAATVLTATVANPHGYGRIVREGEQIARIVEERDADAAEREICEINGGIYAFSLDGLFDAIRGVAADNAQREYYLPDVVGVYRKSGRRVEAVMVTNADEIRGVNSRAELAEVSRLVRRKTNDALMASGVTLDDPATAYIDARATIAADTVIHAGVTIEGTTTIGSGCEIFGGVRIVDSKIGNRVTIADHCLLNGVSVADDATVGPFAHLRMEAAIGPGAKVGNFVEMKKTDFGAGSKAMHLAYLGDARIGAHVNIGAGTITCNYDGTRKNTTVVEDGAFIGSDTQLIAPVTVGKGAYVGSGTTVRQDVPAGALAVSAGRQRNIEGWVEERKKK